MVAFPLSPRDPSTRELGEETEDSIYHTSTISETYDVFTSFVKKLSEKVKKSSDNNADKHAKKHASLLADEIEETPASVGFPCMLTIRF